jgi:superfamily I DNA/RNA helicase
MVDQVMAKTQYYLNLADYLCLDTIMSFEFHLPTLEEMRATYEGLEMLRMGDNDNFRSALISGGPGMGKTTVSVYRLVRLNSQQANVRLVTYQNLLVLAIRSLANQKAVPSHRVSTFHKWYCPLANASFDTDNPPTADQMIECLQRSPLANQGLDEILIDEGQDLPLCVYETIPRYATRCFVGADNAQQVHPNHGAKREQIEQSLRENFAPYLPFVLGRNFRNSYETYRFARQFITLAKKL